MKSIVRLVVILLAILPAVSFAQTGKKTSWPEMKTFHSFMSSTFHPSEENNLKPLKEKADSLLITAKAWQASAIPDNFKEEETKEGLVKLVNQCEIIAGAVKANADDDKLKVMITEAHDIFHNIVDKGRKKAN